jgi:hypothetical protein
MAVAIADLSVSMRFEGMSPVPVSPAVQGESSPETNEGKPRRRQPPPGEASGKQAKVEEESDPPQHRIDSLA